MTVPFWIWAVTFAVILGLFIFDFYSHVRTPHEPTIKESAWWSVVYVLLALVFGGFVRRSHGAAGEHCGADKRHCERGAEGLLLGEHGSSSR